MRDITYRLQSVIQHHGHVTTAGHYTTTLIEAPDKHWFADDGVVAQPSPQMPATTTQNAYLLFLTR